MTDSLHESFRHADQPHDATTSTGSSKSLPRIHKVGVVGAGVMGTGIAAHLASAGFDVLLVDIVPKDAPAAVAKDAKDFAKVRAARNAIVQGGLDRALVLKPAAFQRNTEARRVQLGNLQDDIAALGACDWIVEAVTERLDVKNAVFSAIDAVRGEHTIVSSNTSGIPLAKMAEPRSEGFRKHFLITHFFNPVRYMKLVELVEGAHTDPAVTAKMAAFCQDELGKGVVMAKDTINFIANRIGVHDMMRAVKIAFDQGYRIDEVDAICGEALGRPKSAVFRTADVVGLDTLGHVAQNCYDNLQDDPNREIFNLHPVIQALIQAGATGQKAGAGFYKKVGPDIQVLDPASQSYVPQQKVEYASVKKAVKTPDVRQRVKDMVAAEDRAGQFAWQALSHSLVYSADLLGDIADDVVAIDRAMRWGFNWALGPFEIWDAIGVQAVADRLKAEGRQVPKLVQDLLAKGETSFYADHGKTQLSTSGRVAVPRLPGIHLGEINTVVAENPSAQLLDLGDRVLCLRFRSKMNAIDAGIIAMGRQALELLATGRWVGMVIGNDGANFSVGANLQFIAGLAAENKWQELDAAVKEFQDYHQALKYSPVPIVSAPHAMTFGGGLEMAIHASRMQAAAETYAGLVEVGVGLLPAAGGTKELAVRALDNIPADSRVDRVPLLQRAFEAIALAKVSTGAGQMRDLGYLRTIDAISVDPERRIEDAKKLVLSLVDQRWRPPAAPDNLVLPGADGIAVFEMALYSFKLAGQASDHDCAIGLEVAKVLCGGQKGGLRTEQDLLDLEREGFLKLAGMQKTRDRITHMLTTGKPLRN
jgi:3-hydroxyacyl-CoA dehydrogenase